MPDDGGRRVADESPAVAEPPAYVDVIAGGSEHRVESADRLERVLPERHVASRDVLRDGGGEPERVWPAGAVRAGVRDPTVVRRWEVRSAHADVLPLHEREGEKSQPVNLGVRVVVDERDDLARGGPGADVARGAEPLVLGRDEPDMVLRCDLRRRVGRPVIDHDYLVVRVVELLESRERVAKRRGP